MGKDVIVACDFSSAEQTFAFLDKFTGKKPFVKIGMELYYAEGPEIVRQIKARGHKIFLDLKLHDIPNTVKKSMAVLRNLDVDITNLHAAGTTAMMKAALEGLIRPDGTRPLLIAVTQLTSTDQEAMERDLLIREPIDQVVMHYAETAKNAGLDGVVCSPLEARKVHDRCGKDFLTALNPDSLTVLKDCKLEADLANATVGTPYQFMRTGYFCLDNKDSKPGALVFNRSVSLKDSFKAK